MGENKYNFQKLTPVSDADINVYKEAIDFVFGNEDVKNVAISGAYSAGKSSIIESYKSKHLDKRFVHISLAHFRTPEQEANADDLVKDSVLEGKILNQLIHLIPAESIPQTKFRVKKGVSKKKLISLTIFVSLFLCSLLYIFFSGKIEIYISSLKDNWFKTFLSAITNQYMVISAAIICGICSIAFIYLILKLQKNKNVFRKLSLQGNEIEIFDESDDSYFDKYLNEVLYLFERVKADIIVFEDMDRFNANRIFERLREVNTLVNMQRKNVSKKNYTPLRFFYLLRDDIFVSKDRTKFFDYIMPIVPVVDSSNSYDQFIKQLREGGLLGKFDQRFLQGLSLYVDDMRILKNIYNEFLIYFNRLNNTDLSCNKMLAIVAYKNLFPRDFNDLQIRQGFVNTVFNNKPCLISMRLTELEDLRKQKVHEIERVQNEHLIDTTELDDAYEAKITRLPKELYYNQLSAESKKRLPILNAEKNERKQTIKVIQDNLLSKMEQELSDMEHDISKTTSKALKDIITRENIDEVFSVTHTNEIGCVNEFKEIKGSIYFDLLKYLIRNGYIDETYNDYMTYFYEDSLSANDKKFLRRVTDKRGSDYFYKLNDPAKVASSPVLHDEEFKQEETLNFDLFEYLLQHADEEPYLIYTKTLLKQISLLEKFDFLSKYYETEKSVKLFVETINLEWKTFFAVVLQLKSLPSGQIRQFSIDTLSYSNDVSILGVNEDKCLMKYISDSSDYLAIDTPQRDKLISGFLLIGVKFNSINYEVSDKPLFDEVYHHSLYVLSFENISLMLRVQYHIESVEDISHKNFTLIQQQEKSPLAINVEENMADYIDIILENCNKRIEDDKSIAVSILNHVAIETAAKENYIAFLKTKITDIMEVTDNALWKALIGNKILEFSVHNAVTYFAKDNLIDDALIAYINDDADEFDFSTVKTDFGKEIAEKLFDSVTMCNKLQNEKYRQILLDLHFFFNSYDSTSIVDDKLTILINEEIISMDVDGLTFIRENYANHIEEYIKHNLEEYLKIQTSKIFDLSEILNILSWSFEDSKKTALLSLTESVISIVSKGYSDAVTAHILANNFDNKDKPHIYQNYSKYGQETKVVICNMALKDAQTVIAEKWVLDDVLLSIMLSSNVVKRDHKIMLFTMAIPRLNEDTCKAHFDELELPDLKKIFAKGGRRPNYEKTKEVQNVFDALKLCTWIYEYHEDEGNPNRYIVIKKKPKEKEIH